MADGRTGPGAARPPTSGPNRSRRTLLVLRLRRAVARLLVRGGDATTRWVTRLLGESATEGRAPISGPELRELVAHADGLGREVRRLIDEVIVAGDRHVRELMVPRNQVVFLEAASTVAAANRLVRSARHSRFPVVDGSHDDVVGFVHLRDLLIRPNPDPVGTVGELTRPLRSLPASKGVLSALSEMRRAGDHLALVVDEYGGTAGIVTLEDLIEELVGEIHDEYDTAPESTVEGERPSEVDGLLNLSDFAERVGFALPTGPYDTVGGFVMAALGRLPEVGDEAGVATDEGRWRLRVIELDGRRVSRVELAPPLPTPVTAPALVAVADPGPLRVPPEREPPAVRPEPEPVRPEPEPEPEAVRPEPEAVAVAAG